MRTGITVQNKYPSRSPLAKGVTGTRHNHLHRRLSREKISRLCVVTKPMLCYSTNHLLYLIIHWRVYSPIRTMSRKIWGTSGAEKAERIPFRKPGPAAGMNTGKRVGLRQAMPTRSSDHPAERKMDRVCLVTRPDTVEGPGSGVGAMNDHSATDTEFSVPAPAPTSDGGTLVPTASQLLAGAQNLRPVCVVRVRESRNEAVAGIISRRSWSV